VTTRQDLRDDVRVFRHPPGVRRDIELSLIRDRKRAETRKAAIAALSAIKQAIAVQAKRDATRRAQAREEEFARIRGSRSGRPERLVTTFTGPWDG
jgi:hypothetical protein